MVICSLIDLPLHLLYLCLSPWLCSVYVLSAFRPDCWRHLLSAYGSAGLHLHVAMRHASALLAPALLRFCLLCSLPGSPPFIRSLLSYCLTFAVIMLHGHLCDPLPCYGSFALCLVTPDCIARSLFPCSTVSFSVRFLLPPFTSSRTGRLRIPRFCGSAWLQFLAWFASCPVLLLATAPFSGPVRFSSYYLASSCILLRFLAPGF